MQHTNKFILIISNYRLKKYIDKNFINLQNQNIITDFKITANEIVNNEKIKSDEINCNDEIICDKIIYDNKSLNNETVPIINFMTKTPSIDNFPTEMEDSTNFLFNSFIHILSDSLQFNADDWNLIY